MSRSLLVLAPAALLSLALFPDFMDLGWIVGFSFLRAIALLVGLLCLVALGRLDRWSSSRLLLALLVPVGVVPLTFICMIWQIGKQDLLPPPYSIIYIVLARALPIGVMASTLLPTKRLFLSCVGIALVAGVTYAVTVEPLSKDYTEQKEIAFRRQWDAEEAARQARVASRVADLARVPADAGPEPLLAFLTNSWDLYDVEKLALARLNDTPDVAQQLVRLLDGDRRLDALKTLNGGREMTFPVSNEMRQRSWIVAGLIARDMAAQDAAGGVPPDDIDKLCAAMSSLSTARAAAVAVRAEHRAELVALRDWLRVLMNRSGPWCGGPGLVDGILDEP